MADEKSIWKKEITLRKKPKGVRLPPAPVEPDKPDSVADLMQEQPLDPVVLPPVTPAPPQAAVAVPPDPFVVVSPVPEPRAEGVAEETPVAEPPTNETGEAGDLVGAAVPAPFEIELPPDVEALEPEPEPEAEEPSRRSRKQAERAAASAAKEQAKREQNAAKELRKSTASKHKRVVGLKIGASQIAAAQVVNAHGKGARVVRMARTPLDRGVVVGGELREPEQLVAALKVFFRKNKLPKKAVRLGIANNRIGVRTFELTGIDDPKQLANAIRFRAQETLPIPLDEAVLDYRILEDRVGEDGVRLRKVLLVVAHRELVERYVTACRKAGLKLVGIDLEAFALLRALGGPAQKSPEAKEDAGLVCITIGHDRTTLAVSDGRVCDFTRVLAWGGSSLDVALARVLDATPTEVEPLKHQLSLAEEGEVTGLDAERANEARRAMSAELQAFARELVASLRFYQEQPGSLGIGEILVTGGGAQCAGLVEELERLIGVAVRVADPLGRVKVPRKLRKASDGSTGSLAVAVGLGLED